MLTLGMPKWNPGEAEGYRVMANNRPPTEVYRFRLSQRQTDSLKLKMIRCNITFCELLDSAIQQYLSHAEDELERPAATLMLRDLALSETESRINEWLHEKILWEAGRRDD